MNIFEEAVGPGSAVVSATGAGNAGLDKETLTTALRKIHRRLSAAQCEALFKGYVDGTEEPAVNFNGFCSIAEAVAVNDSYAAEFADVSLSKWIALGNTKTPEEKKASSYCMNLEARAARRSEARCSTMAARGSIGGSGSCQSLLSAVSSEGSPATGPSVSAVSRQSTAYLLDLEGRAAQHAEARGSAEKRQSSMYLLNLEGRAAKHAADRQAAKLISSDSVLGTAANNTSATSSSAADGASALLKRQSSMYLMNLEQRAAQHAASRNAVDPELKRQSSVYSSSMLTRALKHAEKRIEHMSTISEDLKAKWASQTGVDAAGDPCVGAREDICLRARKGLSESLKNGVLEQSVKKRLSAAALKAPALCSSEARTSENGNRKKAPTMQEARDKKDEKVAVVMAKAKELLGTGSTKVEELVKPHEGKIVTIQANVRGFLARLPPPLQVPHNGAEEKGDASSSSLSPADAESLSPEERQEKMKQELRAKARAGLAAGLKNGALEESVLKRSKAMCAVKIQRVVRGNLARAKLQGFDFCNAVILARQRHKAWTQIFDDNCNGEATDGVNEAGFCVALLEVHPSIALPQVKALWKGYLEGTGNESIDIAGFCAVAEAVAAGSKVAAEFADISVEAFEAFGKTGAEGAALRIQAAERGRKARKAAAEMAEAEKAESVKPSTGWFGR